MVVLDTGMSISAFDVKHADLLGQARGPRALRAANGPLEYLAFAEPPIRIGDCFVRAKGDVACFDLEPVRKSFNRNIDGLLGMDVLSALVLSIDFDERKLRLYRSLPATSGKAVELLHNEAAARHIVFVRASIDGAAEFDFTIDTGAIGPQTGSLDGDVFDRFVQAGALRPTASSREVFGAGGTAMVAEARSRAFTLAGYRHTGLAFHRLSFPSSIGLDYLSRYNVVFDFPNSTMYLKPGKNFDHVDVCNRLGVSLRRVDGKLEVKTVVAGAPAAHAGVKEGDRLSRIDQVDTDSLTLRAARRLLSLNGRHILELSRDGVRICLDVEPEDW